MVASARPKMKFLMSLAITAWKESSLSTATHRENVYGRSRPDRVCFSRLWYPDSALGGTAEAFHTDIIATRFTRHYTYESEARMTRKTGETIGESVTELCLDGLRLKNNVKCWDLEEGNLYELSVSMTHGETKKVVFGVRDFDDDGRSRLAVNGRTIFLRSETNCAVFSETGYPPMEVEAWKDILERYRSYGVNCVRFHSHRNPGNVFASEENCRYYRTELIQMLCILANHPSFVMLSFGNELHAGEKGHEQMRALLDAVYHYMESERFVPKQEIALEVIEGLLANTIDRN